MVVYVFNDSCSCSHRCCRAGSASRSLPAFIARLRTSETRCGTSSQRRNRNASSSASGAGAITCVCHSRSLTLLPPPPPPLPAAATCTTRANTAASATDACATLIITAYGSTYAWQSARTRRSSRSSCPSSSLAQPTPSPVVPPPPPLPPSTFQFLIAPPLPPPRTYPAPHLPVVCTRVVAPATASSIRPGWPVPPLLRCGKLSRDVLCMRDEGS